MMQTLWTIAEAFVEPVFQGEPQRQVKPAAEGTQQDQLPVAELIRERLSRSRNQSARRT